MGLEKPGLPVGYGCVLRGIASGNDMRRGMRGHAPFKNKTGPEGQARRTGRTLQYDWRWNKLPTFQGNHRTEISQTSQQKSVCGVQGRRERSDERRAASRRLLRWSLLGLGIMRATDALLMVLGGGIDDRRPGAVITRHQPRQSETTKRRQLDQPRLSDCVHPSFVPHPDLLCNGENF